MLSERLLIELDNLSRTEKLHVVQRLVNELAAADHSLEGAFPNSAQYEIWSPYDSAAAAQQLLDLLAEEKQTEPQ